MAQIRQVWTTARRLPRFPLLIIGIALTCAIFADVINAWVLRDPYATVLSLRHRPPMPFEGSEVSNLLGTDLLGRDVLSRLVLGARFSLLVAMTTITIGGVIGTGAGVVAGYLGGWVEAGIMRLVDIVIALPTILVALVLVTVIGASMWMVVLIVSVIVASRFARIVRADAASLRSRDFVLLAVSAGASPLYVMRYHILPNVASTALVLATLQIGWVIVVEATLSFLNAGVPPPSPTWGNMVAEGRAYLTDAWWVAVLPGVAIAVTVVSFNLLGDWIRDAYDPKLRQVV